MWLRIWLVCTIVINLVASQNSDYPYFELPDRIARECAQKTRVTMVDALGIEDGEFDEINQNVEKYVLCYFRRSGVYNKTDDFQKDVARQTFRFYVGWPQINSRVCLCQCEEDKNPARKAVKLLKCLHANSDDSGNVLFSNSHHSVF